jgi:hypothetical protein
MLPLYRKKSISYFLSSYFLFFSSPLPMHFKAINDRIYIPASETELTRTPVRNMSIVSAKCAFKNKEMPHPTRFAVGLVSRVTDTPNEYIYYRIINTDGNTTSIEPGMWKTRVHAAMLQQQLSTTDPHCILVSLMYAENHNPVALERIFAELSIDIEVESRPDDTIPHRECLFGHRSATSSFSSAYCFEYPLFDKSPEYYSSLEKLRTLRIRLDWYGDLPSKKVCKIEFGTLRGGELMCWQTNMMLNQPLFKTNPIIEFRENTTNPIILEFQAVSAPESKPHVHIPSSGHIIQDNHLYLVLPPELSDLAVQMSSGTSSIWIEF